jgi:hypothetical protein
MRVLSTKKRKVAAALGAGAIAVASAGTAIAFWTSSGGGTGTATSSAGTTGITVSGNGAAAGLAPGVAPEQVTATISNPTPQDAFVTSLHVAIGTISASGTCAASNYQLQAASSVALSNHPAAGAQSIDVAVGSNLVATTGSTTESFYLGFVNDPSVDQSGCKSATVNLVYTTS